MNMLIVMVGIPGSGKTTYAKKLLKEHPDWEYVSRDEVRYQYVTDKEHYFDHEYDVFKEFCNRVDMHLLNGKTVIADATHINKASRDKLINNLTAHIDSKAAVVMNIPFEVCMERNSKREGITRVPDDSMFNMFRKLKVPNPLNENFDIIAKVDGEYK